MSELTIKKVWSDTDFFEIEIVAESDLISATVRSYTTSDSLNDLSYHLINFSEKSDRYIWRNGEMGDMYTPFVSLEFWCRDKQGHITIEVYMEIDDGGSYSKHNCCFYINTELGLLKRFGTGLKLIPTADKDILVTLNNSR